jgi:hypothetical protein
MNGKPIGRMKGRMKGMEMMCVPWHS